MSPYWEVSFANRSGKPRRFRMWPRPSAAAASVVILQTRELPARQAQQWGAMLAEADMLVHLLDHGEPAEPATDPEKRAQTILEDIEDFMGRAQDSMRELPLFFLGCGGGAEGAIRFMEQRSATDPTAPSATKKVTGPGVARIHPRAAPAAAIPPAKPKPVTGVAGAGLGPKRAERANEELGDRVAPGPPSPSESSELTEWVREIVIPWIWSQTAATMPSPTPG